MSEGPTTTAPAPSPKMNAMLRSSRSTRSDSFSTPTTQHAGGVATANHVLREGKRVAKARTRGADVECGRRLGAEADALARRRPRVFA